MGLREIKDQASANSFPIKLSILMRVYYEETTIIQAIIAVLKAKFKEAAEPAPDWNIDDRRSRGRSEAETFRSLRVLRTTVLGVWRRHQDLLSNAGSLLAAWIAEPALGFVYWVVAARLFSQEAVGMPERSVSAMGLLGTIEHIWARHPADR